MSLKLAYKFIYLSTIAFSSLFLAAKPALADQSLQSFAYLSHWMGDSWQNTNLSKIDKLIFFDIKINSDGVISQSNGWPEGWDKLTDSIKENSYSLDLAVSLFSVQDFNLIFNNRASTGRFIDSVVSLASHAQVSGIHIDIEIYDKASSSAISKYKSAIKSLSDKLRKLSPAKEISIFLPAGNGSQIYDKSTLKLFSYIVIQGYDAHWLEGSEAGPVAPLKGNDQHTWEKIFSFVVENEIAPSKALISFPLYGYEWTVGSSAKRGNTIGKGEISTFSEVSSNQLPDIRINILDRISKYGMSYDPESGSSYYKFKLSDVDDDNTYREGWFEDWVSLENKINFLQDKGLRGIAFFPLGYDGGRLIDYFNRRKTD